MLLPLLEMQDVTASISGNGLNVQQHKHVSYNSAGVLAVGQS